MIAAPTQQSRMSSFISLNSVSRGYGRFLIFKASEICFDSFCRVLFSRTASLAGRPKKRPHAELPQLAPFFTIKECQPGALFLNCTTESTKQKYKYPQVLHFDTFQRCLQRKRSK